jgi:peptidoglycan-N-acetylglucosamine deacetylase
MFYRAPFFLPWLYPTLTWRIHGEEKVLYLTFDDGPIPGPTEFILELLKEHQSQATFFCIGDNVQKHPALFTRILKEGHSIGNHTFHHLNGWNTDQEVYLQNVHLCEEELEKHHGYKSQNSSSLFRPPYGKIKRSQISGLKEFDIIMWDVLTYDYDQRITKEASLKNSIRATRPGSIIVFHDSLKAANTMMYILPRFMDYFLSKGYRFKKLPS